MNYLILKDSAPCPHSKVHLPSMCGEQCVPTDRMETQEMPFLKDYDEGDLINKQINTTYHSQDQQMHSSAIMYFTFN